MASVSLIIRYQIIVVVYEVHHMSVSWKQHINSPRFSKIIHKESLFQCYIYILAAMFFSNVIYSGSNVGGGEAASETKYAGTANGAQNFQISPFFLSRQNSCPILTQPQQPNRSVKLFEPVSFFSNAELSHLFEFIRVKTVGFLWQRSRVSM